jgi:hypothetical protein
LSEAEAAEGDEARLWAQGVERTPDVQKHEKRSTLVHGFFQKVPGRNLVHPAGRTQSKIKHGDVFAGKPQFDFCSALVSVKAATNEGLGALGVGAAYAIASV